MNALWNVFWTPKGSIDALNHTFIEYLIPISTMDYLYCHEFEIAWLFLLLSFNTLFASLNLYTYIYYSLYHLDFEIGWLYPSILCQLYSTFTITIHLTFNTFYWNLEFSISVHRGLVIILKKMILEYVKLNTTVILG